MHEETHDETHDETGDRRDPEEMQERLDDLEEDIEQVRAQAKDDDLLPEAEDERAPSYYDPNPGYDDPHDWKGGAPA